MIKKAYALGYQAVMEKLGAPAVNSRLGQTVGRYRRPTVPKPSTPSVAPTAFTPTVGGQKIIPGETYGQFQARMAATKTPPTQV